MKHKLKKTNEISEFDVNIKYYKLHYQGKRDNFWMYLIKNENKKNVICNALFVNKLGLLNRMKTKE